MVICLERGADLHMAQLMPLPLTVSCFSKIQIGFTFLVPAHPGSHGKRAVKRVCVCSAYYAGSANKTPTLTAIRPPNLLEHLLAAESALLASLESGTPEQSTCACTHIHIIHLFSRCQLGMWVLAFQR